MEECHLVDKEAAEDVGGDQGEGVLGGLAEVRAHHCCHDVGIPVESFFTIFLLFNRPVQITDELFKEEEASSKKPDNPLDQLVLCGHIVDPGERQVGHQYNLTIYHQDIKSHLSFIYSTATLMSWIKARSREPKATVPRWYLRIIKWYLRF